ncbi:alcohol dehydrogenase 1 [Gossypium raimondii]|uniref:alcohol dehydrogenase 1 n=1 Tax=Gossypium raimondii TaxID=29730 RepID=UPI00227B8EC3|nr:alcohol dehydrogenase 1 [Gossypium raimondii]
MGIVKFEDSLITENPLLNHTDNERNAVNEEMLGNVHISAEYEEAIGEEILLDVRPYKLGSVLKEPLSFVAEVILRLSSAIASGYTITGFFFLGFICGCGIIAAAVAWESGKPLSIEEVEVAPPQKDEVRIKILFTSLCHTDVYFWDAKGQNPLFPRILGHEAGGIVESVGEGVTDLKPGDHVLPIFTGECKECPHCLSEESNICDLLRINTDRGEMINDGKSRFSINGKPIYHFLGTSTFSEYTVVHVGQVAKINPEAPLDKVCVLSCGMSTGFGATVNVAKPKKGQSVAIFGLGAVGLAAAEGARVSGASRIIGVDLNPSRFDQAKKFGVTEFVNPKDYNKPVREVIVEMTGGGVDRSVECTGSIQAMISAFECVHDGWGVAVLVGVPNKDDAFKTHPVNLLNEKTVKGAFFGNYKPRSDIPAVVEKYMNKELELDKFITHTVPFSEINKAFELMLAGEGLRCVIRMDE